MSGIEVIGIIASVSQLVQYSTRVILILNDICNKTAKSSRRYFRYEQQVRQVIQIADLIRGTQGLQSDLIQSHIDSLTETTRSIEEAMERTLFFAGPSSKMKKCLRILDIPKADATIFQGFEDLERDKSCLTLCLLGSFGSLIVQIQGGMPAMQSQVGDIQRSLQDCTEIAEESKRIREKCTSTVGHHVCSICGCRESTALEQATAEELERIGASAVQSQSLTASERRDSATSEIDSDVTMVGDNNPAQWSGDQYGGNAYDSIIGPYEHQPDRMALEDRQKVYTAVTVHDEASQLNGDVGWAQSDRPHGHCSWTNIRATDKSNQINGNVQDATLLVGFFSRR